MSNENPQEELLQEMARFLARFREGGDVSPVADRDAWDTVVESTPPEQREVVKELARFADLWRYFQERNEKLGPEMVTAISQVHTLPPAERAARLKEINEGLMERVSDAGQGAQFRQ